MLRTGMSARAVISTYNHDENKHGARVEIRVQAFIPVLNIAIWKFPKGNVWQGKHRLVPPQGKGAKASEFKRLVAEYENMKILAKPYLTEAEESCQPDWTKAQMDLARHESMRLNMKGARHEKMEDHLHALYASKRF